MSWRPPERPAWVRAVNAGEVPPLREEAELPFDRDALLGEARARQGLTDGGLADFCGDGSGGDGLGADEWVEPLDRLLRALEEEAELTLLGRWMTRRFLLRLLEVRLQLGAWLRADPGVVDEPIERPLFVAGAPRTGTTILYDLLASDPALRAPLGWELLRPVPPPDPDPARRATDPRVALADRELVLPQRVVSNLRAIHVWGGSRPKECVSAMSPSFRSEEFTGRYHVPSYASWLEHCDMTPAYRMHRLVLQILQRRTGPSAWVLKSPVHMHSLPTLLRLHPEAQVAVTHRDPLVVLASLTSLIASLRHAYSDAVDFGRIAAEHAARYRRAFERLARLCEGGELPAGRLHHSRHADFRNDPVAVVRDLYHRLGRPLDEERLRAVLAGLSSAEHGDHGPHEYAFADTGLDPEAERRAHRRYQACFGVPDEKLPR